MSVSSHRRGNDAVAETLGALLHELCHLVQGVAPLIGGVRRPHSLSYNIILCSMAGTFFGFEQTPLQAGYRDGRGYAPTWKLYSWLQERIEAGDPKVLAWFQNGVNA